MQRETIMRTSLIILMLLFLPTQSDAQILPYSKIDGIWSVASYAISDDANLNLSFDYPPDASEPASFDITIAMYDRYKGHELNIDNSDILRFKYWIKNGSVEQIYMNLPIKSLNNITYRPKEHGYLEKYNRNIEIDKEITWKTTITLIDEHTLELTSSYIRNKEILKFNTTKFIKLLDYERNGEYEYIEPEPDNNIIAIDSGSNNNGSGCNSFYRTLLLLILPMFLIAKRQYSNTKITQKEQAPNEQQR